MREIFTVYWSQVTLILLGIGYLIKRILDNKSKKKEINHSLYQQNRLIAINNFFRNYSTVELMWKQIHIWAIISNKKTAEEIDQYIWPSINSLKTSIIELQIYLDEDDNKLLDQVLENILDINQELSLIFFQPNNNELLVTRTNKFIYYRDEIVKKNNDIIKVLANKIRKLFSVN